MGRNNFKFELFKNEVVASRGVIVSNHPLASSAGIEMFSRGGNAFDAAIATLFALTVVEPMMISVFGAGFFVLRNGKTGKIETIDNYAVAPLAAKDDMYELVKERKPGQNIFETVGRKNLEGPLAVATPGTLKAWEYVNRIYGKLSFKTVIKPAIKLAREGYESSPYMSFWVDYIKESMKKYPTTSKTFMPENKTITPGTWIVMPEYADTLELIAKGGSDVLYGGPLGKLITDYMEDVGGLITADDLEDYKIIMRDPIKGVYRNDYEIYAMAPGSSGGTHIIQILNILESFDISSMGFGSVEHLHHTAEAIKIAFNDRQKYMGDPEKIKIPLTGLTSKQYARARANEISDNAVHYKTGDLFSFEYESKNTTHMSVMDSDGNVIAATQSLNGPFGSCVTVPDTGVLLNNCMALFDPRPNQANSVAGGKRMLSSMSPTIIMSKDEPYLCIGTPGGLRIFPSVAQAIVNIIDFGMSIQEAVEAPRIWTMGIKGTPGEKLLVEPGFRKEVISTLNKKGHEVVDAYRVAGGMNGVLRNPDSKMLHGGACWRADGTPMGISGGRAAAKALVTNPLL